MNHQSDACGAEKCLCSCHPGSLPEKREGGARCYCWVPAEDETALCCCSVATSPGVSQAIFAAGDKAPGSIGWRNAQRLSCPRLSM